MHGADDDIAYPSGSEEMKSLLTSSSDVDLQVNESTRGYPCKPSKFQAMGSSAGELSIFLAFVPGKIGRDFS